jgi:hypothetical protein
MRRGVGGEQKERKITAEANPGKEENEPDDKPR